MHAKVERAVRNQVRHHEHPWIGRDGTWGRGDFWRSDGDERHDPGVGDCRKIESEVWKTNRVLLRATPEAIGFIYSFSEVRAIGPPCDIRYGCGKGAKQTADQHSKPEW